MFFNITKNYHTFLRNLGTTILHGPFKGMKYLSRSSNSAYIPKILGIYEKEIYSVLLDFLNKSDLFINIGCAEGYYAVGSALRYPHLNIITYDIDKESRQFLSKLKTKNDVQNINIKKKFSDTEFSFIQNSSYQNFTYLIDIEGEELNIFSKYYNHFNNSYFIIELHDKSSKKIESYLKKFFSQTHSTYSIPIKNKLISDLPIKVPLLLKIFKKRSIKKHLLSEWREYKQSFLVCKPKI